MKTGDERVESWEEVLSMMNTQHEHSTLERLKDVYGLNGWRVKGIVLEFDPKGVKAVREDIDRRYPYLKDKRQQIRDRVRD